MVSEASFFISLLDIVAPIPYTTGMNERTLGSLDYTLQRLRDATRTSEYEGKLFLVGGILRDLAMGLPITNDLDLVLEGDAIGLAHHLHSQGLSTHYPVLYPRFGTAMISMAQPDGGLCNIELVSARAESYHPDSRKPEVTRGTIREDVYRRDFTINTLLQNLHTGEVLDITGLAKADIAAGTLRTPLSPKETFYDDPLRMLRAVRFATRFDFRISEETWDGMCTEAARLQPPTIAFERIRDEFEKIMRLPSRKARRGLELLRESNLLIYFLPEMLPMIGCVQGGWHKYDVWQHTLEALDSLPNESRLELRLGLLWHDIGKPPTRTEDERGIHFYGHHKIGAEITRGMMNHLKFPNEVIRDVTFFVSNHMKLGEYRPDWSDAAVKRLIRDCGTYLEELFVLTRCDHFAMNIPLENVGYLDQLKSRIADLNAQQNVLKIQSPLEGNEIMEILNCKPGIHIRKAKEYLLNEVIEGRLGADDKKNAEALLVQWWITECS